MINADLFEIDFHIFTDIKILFNLMSKELICIKITLVLNIIFFNDRCRSIRNRFLHFLSIL